MAKCKKCGSKLLTCTAYAENWRADREPYEDGVYEENHKDHDFSEDVYLTAEYCEECKKFEWIHIDDDCINKGEK